MGPGEVDDSTTGDRPSGTLRYGWTTGACAAGASRAALEALLTGRFPDTVSVTLPRGHKPVFTVAFKELADGHATAGIVKDAGDDPDITHGALIRATVEPAAPGSGIIFRAGEGVGTVTRPGLPRPPGEPALTPRPRAQIRQALHDGLIALGKNDAPLDFIVTVSIPGGAALAEKTLNRRLGIVGGLSILGTTGVVVPYSCAAWIHSIHRGIDVARAAGLTHIAAATGSTSEAAIKAMYRLDEVALIDMGDFAGGTLKYLRNHPVLRLTIAGGFGKLSKLAAGHLDLHSGRSQVDVADLAACLADLGLPPGTVAAARQAASAGEVLKLAGEARGRLAELVARRAREVALAALAGETTVDVAVFDRAGALIGHALP